MWDKEGGGERGKTVWVSVREGGKGKGLRFLVSEEEGGEKGRGMGRGRGKGKKEGGKVFELPAFDASELLIGCSEAEERVVMKGKEKETLERALYCREGEGEEVEEGDPLGLFLDLQEIPKLLPSQVFLLFYLIFVFVFVFAIIFQILFQCSFI